MRTSFLAAGVALVSASQCNEKDWQTGISYKNREYTSTPATSPADCCAKCAATTKIKCTYWTYEDSVCWLKTNNGNPISCKTCTSGGLGPLPPTPPPTAKPTPMPRPPLPPTPAPTPWDNKPVQVYIMMGQSNMLGEGKIFGDQNGTLEYAVTTEKKYPYLWDATRNDWALIPNTRNVFIMGSGNSTYDKSTLQHNESMYVGGATPGGSYETIGPEFGIAHFGGYKQDHVMLLKSCIGDRSLGWDLLPPGSPGFDYTDSTNTTWTYAGYHQSPEKWKKGETPPASPGWMAGEQYDGDTANAQYILDHFDEFSPGIPKYEIAGFFWWQGDKDSRDMGLSSRYEYNLVNLIKTLRKQYNAPNAKFVTASLGQTVKGDTDGGGLILDAMLNVDGTSGKYPEFKGNVAAVYTHPLSMGSSSGSHYGGDARTYMNVGEAMGAAMAKLIQGDSA